MIARPNESLISNGIRIAGALGYGPMTDGWFSMTDKRIVFSTAGSEEEAGKIAHELVVRKLAACVNIVPQIESIYRWQDKVESSREWLLIIKTTSERVPVVCQTIRDLHSYELPECVAIAVEDGSPGYLHWIDQSVGKS